MAYKINKNNFSLYTYGSYPFGDASANLVRQLVVGLRENDINCRVHLIRGKEEVGPKYIKHKNYEPYNYVFFKYKHKSELLKIIEIIGSILILPLAIIRDKYYWKINCIIIYGVEYFYYSIVFIFFCKIIGIKTIAIKADSYNRSMIVPIFWKSPKYFFFKLQKKHFDKYYSGIVCLSNQLAKEAVINGVKENKVIVIPHFIDVSNFAKKEACEKDLSDIIRIGYCGTISEENGVLFLLNAFEKLYNEYKNIDLLLIGDSNRLSTNSLSVLNLMINRFNGKIICTGKVDYRRIPDFLHTCNVLVNPRPNSDFATSGFPTKLGEYLACQKAVVTTGVGDISQYFTNGNQLIIVAPNSVDSLVEGIRSLILNRLLAKSIASNGYEWVSNNIDYKITSKKFLDFARTV